MRAHISCNCHQCKAASPEMKAWHKKMAHKGLRRAAKLALKNGREAPVSISTGYKD